MNTTTGPRLRRKKLSVYNTLSVLTDVAIPVADASPAPVPEQQGPTPVAPIKPSLNKWDLAQVTKADSPSFGIVFVVGEIKNGKVHGYYLTQGPTKVFVTVNAAECEYVGSLPEGIGLVRSKTPCSEQWLKGLP